MIAASDAIVVLTTCPDTASAEQLARLLLEERLVACAQLEPIRSLYRWEGKLCDDGEVRLLLKTRRPLLEALEATLRAHHPYTTPQLLAFPIDSGSADYLAWLAQETERLPRQSDRP